MEHVEYIDENEYIILYRVFAPGSIAEIPSEIAGKPVKVLADHLFANEPSAFYQPHQIRRAVLRAETYEEEAILKDAESFSEDRETEALSGARIEIIRIPEGVEGIGNYAFYGCYCLKEVSFPSSMKRIGYGLFNGCRQVSRLNFELGNDRPEEGAQTANPSVMKEVLDAVSNESRAVVTYNGEEQWQLTFPEYYEEGKENTPARIIEIVYHGTGHQYRNCFLNRKIQFDRYDEVFPLAAAQEIPDTCISIIRNRLRSGPEPKEEWKVRYIEYLRSEINLLTQRILEDREYDPVSELQILDRNGFFASNNVDLFIRRASELKRADAVSFLMDVKRRQSGSARKSKYELL